MKIIFITLFFVAMVIPPAFPQNKNYCHDKESWKEWDELIQKHPHNMDIQMLHAVRIGFCKKIEDGTISFEAARDAFIHLQETAYKKAKKEQGQLLKNKQL